MSRTCGVPEKTGRESGVRTPIPAKNRRRCVGRSADGRADRRAGRDRLRRARAGVEMEEKKNHTAEYAAAAAAAARRVRADVANESRAFVRESCVFPSPPSSSGARTDGGLLLVLFFANAAEVYTRYRRDASARRGGGATAAPPSRNTSGRRLFYLRATRSRSGSVSRDARS